MIDGQEAINQECDIAYKHWCDSCGQDSSNISKYETFCAGWDYAMDLAAECMRMMESRNYSDTIQ